MARQNLVITTSGKYRVKPELVGKAAGSLIFYVSGDLGGGTLQLEYLDTFGNYIPLVDGIMDVGNQYQCNAGIVENLYIALTNATAPNANVIVTGKV